MAIILEHVATLVASSTALALAWWSGREGRSGSALFWILVCGFVLRLDLGLHWQLWPWDERYHALVAKNFLADPWTPRLYPETVLPERHGDWTTAGIWLHKPPLASWLLALALGVFGENAVALRVPSFALSLAGVWITYRIGRYAIGPEAGLVAAGFQATNGVLLDLAAGRRPVDHVDTLLFVLVGAAVLALARGGPWPRRLLVLAPLTALALLAKTFPGYLIPVLAAVALRAEGDSPARVIARAATLTALATALAAPWFLYAAWRWPNELAASFGYMLRHFPAALEAHAGGPGFHLALIGRFFGEGAWLAIALLLWTAARERDAR
ncbi:MAG: hypothetical protein QOD06_2646, partial [Candidatus Binatota bacterium]|nr:hypothetical protein [Candidatus Binatota bacterium]